MNNTPMLENWVQNFKNHTSLSQKYFKKFPFFMHLKHVQSLAFDFKPYIILVKSIATIIHICFNLLSLYITPRS
jgi:hypothetical protein